MSHAAQPVGAPFLASRLSRSWGLVLLRGVLGVLFGVAVLTWPGLSLIFFMLMFGVYAMAEGLGAIFAAIFGGGLAGRWWMALAGVFSILAGCVAVAMPGLTAVSILWVIGIWAIARGVAEVIGAVLLRKEVGNPWALGVAGFLSLLFGLALVAAPGAGALALLWLIGGWAVAFGILTVILAFQLRSAGR